MYLLLVRRLLEVLLADMDHLVFGQSQGPGHAGARSVRRVWALGDQFMIPQEENGSVGVQRQLLGHFMIIVTLQSSDTTVTAHSR